MPSLIKILCTLFLTSVCLGVSAHAQYIFDPADLPDDFECIEDASEEECESDRVYEAWANKYWRAHQAWRKELIFNVNYYFEPPQLYDDDFEYTLDSFETPNLVDVQYYHSFTNGWAFAIDMVCLKHTNANNEDESCEPVIREVSFDPKEIKVKELSDQISLPTSLEDTAKNLIPLVMWREANLRSCIGAIDHLVNFPPQNKHAIWHKKYEWWLYGKTPRSPDEIIITADGDGVLVRAQSKDDPESKTSYEDGQYVTYYQSNGGRGYDWAKKMYKLVEPCLNASNATPPWQKVLDAEKKRQVLKQY